MSQCYIGEIRLLPYVRGAPGGWVVCNGSMLPISDYDVLYQLIGTTYGGDGQNTFAVPDLRGRVPLHQGAGGSVSPHPLGQVGGRETVTLVPQQMGAHQHTVLASATAAASGSPVDTVLAASAAGFYNVAAAQAPPSAFPANTLRPTGGNAAHDNTAPTLTLQYCIAWSGIYPAQ